MDNHLRIERKENLRIERKEKTQRPTDQPKGGKDGERKRKRGKDRSKRKNKNNTSTKDACKYCKNIPSETS
jgi:hypothetical protein